MAAGHPERTRYDLPSREAALEHVFANMCESCKKERATALKLQERFARGEHWATVEDDMCDLFPGCFYEWYILKTKDLKNAKSDEEVAEAAGWKTIYKRP